MLILQNHRFALLVMLVSIILLSPCKIIFAVDDMPTFTEDDFADCTITGMKLDYAFHYATETFTESSGAFWDENGIPQEPSTSFIDFLLYYYLSAEEARTRCV